MKRVELRQSPMTEEKVKTAAKELIGEYVEIISKTQLFKEADRFYSIDALKEWTLALAIDCVKKDLEHRIEACYFESKRLELLAILEQVGMYNIMHD